MSDVSIDEELTKEKARIKSRRYYKKLKKENPQYIIDKHRRQSKKRKASGYYLREDVRKKNREKYLRWKEKNKGDMADKNRKKYIKRKSCPKYRIGKNISRSIRRSLNGNKDGLSWERILGYTRKELHAHLENKFTDGMTWDNYGGYNGWEIDHIKPISFFNYTTYECYEFKECWSLNNLRPLWKRDNASKGDSMLEYQKITGKLF